MTETKLEGLCLWIVCFYSWDDNEGDQQFSLLAYWFLSWLLRNKRTSDPPPFLPKRFRGKDLLQEGNLRIFSLAASFELSIVDGSTSNGACLLDYPCLMVSGFPSKKITCHLCSDLPQLLVNHSFSLLKSKFPCPKFSPSLSKMSYIPNFNSLSRIFMLIWIPHEHALKFYFLLLIWLLIH